MKPQKLTKEQVSTFFDLFEKDYSLREISQAINLPYEKTKKFLYNHRQTKEKIVNKKTRLYNKG